MEEKGALWLVGGSEWVSKERSGRAGLARDRSEQQSGREGMCGSKGAWRERGVLIIRGLEREGC